MTGTGLLRSFALAGSLVASLSLLGCNDTRRTAHASTTVAKAEVSTELPPSQVSDEFLQATATVAADAVSVPHPVAAAVVVPPPEPLPPPPSNNDSNQMPSAANGTADAANRQ